LLAETVTSVWDGFDKKLMYSVSV